MKLATTTGAVRISSRTPPEEAALMHLPEQVARGEAVHDEPDHTDRREHRECHAIDQETEADHRREIEHVDVPEAQHARTVREWDGGDRRHRAEPEERDDECVHVLRPLRTHDGSHEHGEHDDGAR